MLSQRSKVNDCVEGKYHAFDFNWQAMILKAYENREIACGDEVYGTLFTSLYKLNDDIVKNRAPVIWRKGMDDPYGFASIAFSDSVGDEMDVSGLGLNYNNKPKNLRMMSEPHPSAAVKVENYITVPLVP